MILVYNLSLEQMCQSFIFNFFTLVHFPFFFHFPCFIKSMLRLYKNTFVIIKYFHYTIHIIFFMFHEKCIIKQCFIRIYKLSQNKIERKTKSIKEKRKKLIFNTNIWLQIYRIYSGKKQEILYVFRRTKSTLIFFCSCNMCFSLLFYVCFKSKLKYHRFLFGYFVSFSSSLNF